MLTALGPAEYTSTIQKLPVLGAHRKVGGVITTTADDPGGNGR